MVNSNVIRGGGLIILAGSYVAISQIFTKNVVDDATNLFVGLVGAGHGSMYNTCSGDSKTLKKLTSANLKDKAATDLKYSFYNIANPKEYLAGSDAVVVEQGPYNLKKHSVAYNVVQQPSVLTAASEPAPNGALEYSTANAYLVLDRDVTPTTNLKRDADLKLASGNKATLPVTKRALAGHLSMTDTVVNVSPDYLSFLGAMNDEVNMILSLVCTSDQIANIGVAEKGQCTDIADTNCACCMKDDDYELATSRNDDVPPAYTNCNSFFDDEGPILSTLSRLASHDGGVAVTYGQAEIHTALLQNHTINDLMFGHPSAYLGYAAFIGQMDQAKQSLTSSQSNTELAKSMLTGQMDANLSFKLGNVAEYTSKVGSVCFATCIEGGDCSGQAPGRHETSDVDKIKLGGIECKPYTSTFKTVEKCNEINAELQLDGNAPGYDACVCANGSDEWSSQGCCLAGGVHNGSNLIGEGCLFEVIGVVDPNYVGMDVTIANAVDLGTALQSWRDREDPNPSSEFMCPAHGQGLDEHVKFGHYESYGGSTGHTTYYYTGNDRMRQDDVTNTAAAKYSTPVTGGSGKYFQPKGLTVFVGSSQITDGFPLKIPHQVYVPNAKKSVDFVFEGVRDKFLRNKICGTDTCLVSARMIPNATVFSATAENDGTGMPFDGLQSVGHVSGPSTTGRPEYFHQPLYFDGDETLYTQQDNSHVDRATGNVDGNGIKIYRPSIESDPGTFDPSEPGSNYQLVDKAYVDSQKEVLQSHIDIEVASGLGARQRMRFGKSHSIWECDPSTNEKCKLAVNSNGSNACYVTEGSTQLNALTAEDQADLTTLGRSDFTYPCSAANLLTPHVVGGKILPVYWYEESTIHLVAEEVDLLAGYADSYAHSGYVWMTASMMLFLAIALGTSMLLLCLCFEQRHDHFLAKSEETAPLKE